MNQETELPANGGANLSEDLIALSSVDTVYGDLYLQRARDLLAPVLTRDDYAAIRRLQTEALALPTRIRGVMEQGNWREVQSLSARLATLKRNLAEKQTLAWLGEELYGLAEPPLDPFSPGLQAITNIADRELEPLRNESLQRLERLAKDDPEWQSFYADRSRRLSELKLDASEESDEEDVTQIEKEALEALNSGNFEKLEKLAADLVEEQDPAVAEGASPARPGRFTGGSSDLSYAFAPEVLDRATKLGLAPMRIEAGSRVLQLPPHEMARLYCHVWHPTFTEQIRNGTGLKEQLSLPADTPAALLDLLELFTLHPFINSGGARFLPFLGEEDVLVENFEEPDPERPAPVSGVLAALGFEDRRGLSRTRIESALLERGNRIVAEVGLDPRMFRLLCIPPDLYLRIGIERGWGRKPLWTHFDGYMVMQNRKLGALAGGDVRFGGLYDLLGIGRDYDSDRIIARFAIVQRRRMEGCS